MPLNSVWTSGKRWIASGVPRGYLTPHSISLSDAGLVILVYPIELGHLQSLRRLDRQALNTPSWIAVMLSPRTSAPNVKESIPFPAIAKLWKPRNYQVHEPLQH